MSKELFTRIISKDRVSKIPNELIHFFHPTDQKVLDIPLDMNGSDFETVRREFGNYDTLEDLIKDKSLLSQKSIVVVDIIQSLGLKNFLIEYIDDWDWATIEFIQFIVADGVIIKESTINNTNEAGDLYSTIHLNYDYHDYIYDSYKTAKSKYYDDQSRSI